VFFRSDRRRMTLALVIAIAVLTVAIPTCVMIGCDMGLCGPMMRMTSFPGPAFLNQCSGTWLANAGQVGALPTEFVTAFLAMLAFVAMLLGLFSSSLELRAVTFVEANAPPPPLDPRGERFRI